MKTDLCYCCSEKKFSNCCEPFISGSQLPETPEELMRSRYSAFCLKDGKYLYETTDPQTRMEIDHKGNEDWAHTVQFLNLEILQTSTEKNKGTVEFKAKFKDSSGAEQIHHEIAKFRRQGGQWFFRDGKNPGPK